MSNSSQPHGLQHAKLPCPSPSPGVCPSSCPLNRWCHLTVPSRVTPFFSWPQSFPASGSFPMSQLFSSGGQNIRTSASTSVFSVSIQGWLPLRLTVPLIPRLLLKLYTLEFSCSGSLLLLTSLAQERNATYSLYYFLLNNFQGTSAS